MLDFLAGHEVAVALTVVGALLGVVFANIWNKRKKKTKGQGKDISTPKPSVDDGDLPEDLAKVVKWRTMPFDDDVLTPEGTLVFDPAQDAFTEFFGIINHYAKGKFFRKPTSLRVYIHPYDPDWRLQKSEDKTEGKDNRHTLKEKIIEVLEDYEAKGGYTQGRTSPKTGDALRVRYARDQEKIEVALIPNYKIDKPFSLYETERGDCPDDWGII